MRHHLILSLVVTLAACSAKKNNGSTSGSSAGGSSGSSSGSSSGDAANTYLLGLPGWPAPSADNNAATAAASNDYVTGTDSLTYKCTTTPYSLTTTPEKIVTFDPTADVLWPGALIQGKAYQAGTLEALPLTERAPITVSIPTLLFAGNSEVVSNPTEATVEAAIGDIIGAAVTANVAASSSISYTQTTAYSADQAALSLGISASYVGQNIQASLGLSQSSDLHSVIGYFVQNMFTVTVPEPEHPGDFFAGLTQADIDAAVANDTLGPTNLPVYIASVTYGRIMMFSITSRASVTEIQGALNAQWSGLVASGTVDTKYSQLMSNGSTVIKVVTVGGDATNAEAMISSGDPTKFFDSNPAISTAVPITYTLRNLGNNSIAALSETTAYNVQTCVESTTGAGANIYIADTPATGPALRAYDAAGAVVALTDAVTGTASDSFFGIAWDSLDDEIFIQKTTNTGPGTQTATIIAVNPDGTALATAPTFTFDSAHEYPGRLAYDVKHDHIIATVEIDRAQDPDYDQVRIYSPNGNQSGTSISVPYNVTGVTYDAHDNHLYVTTQHDGGATHLSKVTAYSLDGTPQATEGTFQVITSTSPVTTRALYGPQDIIYDEQHDRFYVADNGGGSGNPAAGVASFDGKGNNLAWLTGLDAAPFSVTYDPVNERVIVGLSNGEVQFFDTDLLPVTEANGAFPLTTDAWQMAFRP